MSLNLRWGAAVDEEEDAACDAGAEEAVDEVDGGAGLAGAGGHGEEDFAFAFGLLDGGDGLALVGAKFGGVVGVVGKPLAGGVEVANLAQRGRGGEALDGAGGGEGARWRWGIR